MPISDAQVQALIILEVGDEITTDFPDGILTANIADIWESYADFGDARLQRLYSKRNCIDLVLGIVRKQVDFEITDDHSRKQAQKATALQKMRADCQAEIGRIITASDTVATGISFVPAVYGGESTADEFARPECWP